MLELYNSLGKIQQPFKSRSPDEVKIFTCGPSVYQRAHIGNYRTFLYEDILVRYLEYQGYKVKRAMNLTDIEDKAVTEAAKNGKDVFSQTEPTKKQFAKDLQTLFIKEPILAMASTSIKESIEIIALLLKNGIAYNHKGDIYFNPLKYKDFGKLFGLDKSKWPAKTIRYKKDTYPGMRWNLGDFILWHKADKVSYHTNAAWDSPWGKGRPSWNVQDPAMIYQTLGEQVDINCGGIDNIIRHHDYNIAVMESAFKKDYAQFYLHGAHLYVDGKKMSKSLGNIYYPDDLIKRGYTGEDIRFFLIAVKHYRQKLNFTDAAFAKSSSSRKEILTLSQKVANTIISQNTQLPSKITAVFTQNMNKDLSVAQAIKDITKILKQAKGISAQEKQELKMALQNINTVLQIGLGDNL